MVFYTLVTGLLTHWLRSLLFKNNSDHNQVADERFSLKQGFAAGAHSCRLRKPGFEGALPFFIRVLQIVVFRNLFVTI